MLPGFNKKTEIVFANLIEHPELTDSALSKKIGIKRSTVTAIKNRLKAGGYYERRFIPNLFAIGCELFGFMHIKFASTAPRQVRRQSPAFAATVNHPELVYARSTDNEHIGFYCGRDLYNIRKVQDFRILDYESRGFIQEVNRVYYPTELSEIRSFLNYGPFVKRLLGIENKEGQPLIWKDQSKGKLTKTEKLVLSAMVKWPEANNMELARKIKKTRATISNVRADLVEKGMVKMVNIPITAKLGCELLVYISMKFNPKCHLEARQKGIDLLVKEAAPIIDISGNTEASSLWIFRNYTEYMEVYNSVIGYFKEHDYLSGEPSVMIMPINQLKWRKLDFSALTDKLLFGKE